MYHYINFRKTDFKHHMMNQHMIIKCIYINFCYDCECDAVICVLTIFSSPEHEVLSELL